jgi:hypothetical protein
MKLVDEVLNLIDKSEAKKRIKLSMDIKLEGEDIPKDTFVKVIKVKKVGAEYLVNIESFDGLKGQIKVSGKDAKKMGIV